MPVRAARTLWAVGAATTLLLGLTACGSDEPAPPQSPTSPTSVTVSDSDLGLLLNTMAFHGTGGDAGSAECLLQGVTEAGVSRDALVDLSQMDPVPDSFAGASVVLMGQRPDDAQLLTGEEVGAVVDECTAGAQEPSPTSTEASPSSSGPTSGAPTSSGSTSGTSSPSGDADFTPPPPPEVDPDKEADLEPTIRLRESQKVDSASRLEPGLLEVFSSYALTTDQRASYMAASRCMADFVHGSGLSQKSLRFLAEGPRIGVGSVADYLPEKKDQELWRSQAFTDGLMGCLSQVTKADLEKAKQQIKDEGGR